MGVGGKKGPGDGCGWVIDIGVLVNCCQLNRDDQRGSTWEDYNGSGDSLR